MAEREAIIVSAVSTPIGSFGSSLKDALHEKLRLARFVWAAGGVKVARSADKA